MTVIVKKVYMIVLFLFTEVCFFIHNVKGKNTSGIICFLIKLNIDNYYSLTL